MGRQVSDSKNNPVPERLRGRKPLTTPKPLPKPRKPRWLKTRKK